MNVLVEVHTRWGEIDYYLVQRAKSEEQAKDLVIAHYRDEGKICSPQQNDEDHYIFSVRALEKKPVVHLFGEYRSSHLL